MPSNCSAGEDLWKSLEQQGDQASQSEGRSTLNIHWKDWPWSWSSSILVTWCKQTTHWKSPWFWERSRVEGKKASEDEMIGCYHQCNEHEPGPTPGDDERQGGLACCSTWGLEELARLGDWTTITTITTNNIPYLSQPIIQHHTMSNTLWILHTCVCVCVYVCVCVCVYEWIDDLFSGD